MGGLLCGKRVLVVEDEWNIRHMIKLFLQKEGCEVLEAADAVSARASFMNDSPNFVILDIVLPGEYGTSICRWIRDELGSDVPIMFVSARSAGEAVNSGLKSGADDFLPKPFSPIELVARVERILSGTA